MRRVAVVAGLLLVTSSVLSGQRKWVGPQSPCDIKPGFFRLNSAVVDLQKAVEQPRLRERMLGQALEVLTRSIREDKQDQNPAAWYYLGRYYVEVGDAAGADSALGRAAALAPQCRADIDGHRQQLASRVLSRGLTAWHADHQDSAAALLRLAYRLDPSRPGPLFQLGALYLDGGHNDSATAVLREAARVAGTDTAYAVARRDALLTVARLVFTRTQSDSAVQRWQRSRYSRDSLQPHLAADSMVLARMQQSAASRRARRARLSPADQQAFTRDSTARAEALARERATGETLGKRAAADSAAAQAAYEPAITAYRELVTAYPADADAATTLAAIYAQAGRAEEVAGVFDGLFDHAALLSTTKLHELGRRLVQGRMMGPGTKAYTLLLQRNPYDRNALFELISAYVEVKDSAAALAAARRLLALDPLNKAALRLIGEAWGLSGRSDSSATYAALADSLPVDITIASMVRDGGGVTLTGVASNLGDRPSRPFRIVVELLDSQGSAVTSGMVAIAAIAPGGNHQFQLKGAGDGIVGWRYHRP